jgi:hypothetical protein
MDAFYSGVVDYGVNDVVLDVMLLMCERCKYDKPDDEKLKRAQISVNNFWLAGDGRSFVGAALTFMRSCLH